MFTAVMVGCVVGTLAPCGINTDPGVMVTRDGSLLASVTETPPGGAAASSVTGYVIVWPTCTDTFPGRLMSPGAGTLTLAVAGEMEGALAKMVVLPAAAPVTVTRAVFVFGAMETVA